MANVFLCYLHPLVLPHRYTVIPSQYYFLNIWEKLCYFIQIFSMGKICPILQFLSYFSILSWLLFRPNSYLPKTPVANIPIKIFHRTEDVSPDAIKPVKNTVYTIFCTLHFCYVYHRRIGHFFFTTISLIIKRKWRDVYIHFHQLFKFCLPMKVQYFLEALIDDYVPGNEPQSISWQLRWEKVLTYCYMLLNLRSLYLKGRGEFLSGLCYVDH